MGRLKRDFSAFSCYHLTSWTALHRYLLEWNERGCVVQALLPVAEDFGIEILSYCVLANHFHLLIRTSDRFDVSGFMQELKQRTSIDYNRAHPDHRGNLWEPRFKCVEVQDEPRTVAVVAAFIETNPVRLALVGDPREYDWSSCRDNCQPERLRLIRDKLPYFKPAARAFTEGGAVGDGRFVADFIRNRFISTHKAGPRMLPGGVSAWGDLRVAREKRPEIV